MEFSDLVRLFVLYGLPLAIIIGPIVAIHHWPSAKSDDDSDKDGESR